MSLSMATGGRNDAGLDHYLIVLGPDVKFPAWDNPPPGVVVHISPERVGGVGPWAD